MELLPTYPVFVAALHAAIIAVVGRHVVMRQSARGVAPSWLLPVAALPHAGAHAYLPIGDRRIGRRRRRGIGELRIGSRKFARTIIPEDLPASTAGAAECPP